MDFRELTSRISRKLKGIACKLNGHPSFLNEEDLYQEAMVHLWLDCQGGKLTDKTDSYILQSCYFHLKNYLRKNYDKARLVSLENSADEEGKELNLDNILSLGRPESSFELINAKLLI